MSAITEKQNGYAFLSTLGLPPLPKRSNTALACFPGNDGEPGYGAHFDGNPDDGCYITMILYTSPEWAENNGGRLELFDERDQVWWALPPRADTLLLFRSDRVMHRVEPHRRHCKDIASSEGIGGRYAMTIFLQEGGRTAADKDAERDALVSRLTQLY